MNKERLFELAEVIENAPPDQFHMGSWFGHLSIDEDTAESYWNSSCKVRGNLGGSFLNGPYLKELTCGTTACIAGWAYALKHNFDPSTYTEDAVEEIARDYLDLTREQVNALFYANIGSVWHRYQDEYTYEVVTYDEEYDYEAETDPDYWNVTNKDAADILKRIARGEIHI